MASAGTTNSSTRAAFGPLSPPQRAIWLLDQVASLTHTTIARLEGRPDEAAIRAGLDRLQERHPLLRARIVAAEPPRFVEGVGPLPLRVEPWTPDAWLRVAAEEVNRPLPWEKGPLGRAVLLVSPERFDLLLTLHHAIAEGVSGVIAMRDLLELIAAAMAGDAPRLPSLLHRDLVTLARGRGSWWGALTFLGRYLVSLVFLRSHVLPPETWVPFAERWTRFVSRSFTAEQTSAIIASCKAYRVTVHGALCAGMLLAIAEELRGQVRQRWVGLTCFSPVSLRRFFKPPVEDVVGYFASAIISRHQVTATTAFWDLATEVSGQVTDSLRREEPFSTMRLHNLALRGKNDPQAMVRGNQRFPVPAVMVSNFGRFEQIERPQRPFRLLELSGGISANAMETMIAVAACTFEGRLCVNLLHPEPLISAARANRLADRATQIIERAARSGSGPG